MPLFDKRSKATQDDVQMTKDLTDTTRHNSLIADENKQIVNLYSQIGKLYYETQQHDPETPLGKLCTEIDAANERIAGYDEERRRIKGTKRCASCGAEIPVASAFCGVCGVKAEPDEAQPPSGVEKPSGFCTGCGAKLGEGMIFCTSCGMKQAD